MVECIYQNSKYKIMRVYDGYQVWSKFGYVRTFKVLAQAVKYIEMRL